MNPKLSVLGTDHIQISVVHDVCSSDRMYNTVVTRSWKQRVLESIAIAGVAAAGGLGCLLGWIDEHEHSSNSRGGSHKHCIAARIHFILIFIIEAFRTTVLCGTVVAWKSSRLEKGRTDDGSIK